MRAMDYDVLTYLILFEALPISSLRLYLQEDTVLVVFGVLIQKLNYYGPVPPLPSSLPSRSC